MGELMGNITIVRNVYKKDPVQPDYRGKIDIEGASYDIVLWVNNNILRIPLHLSGEITEQDHE